MVEIATLPINSARASRVQWLAHGSGTDIAGTTTAFILSSDIGVAPCGCVPSCGTLRHCSQGTGPAARRRA